MSIRENVFKTRCKKKIKKYLPDCALIDLNGSELQGLLDLLIINGTKWAMLEFKRSANSSHRPNQDYYVNFFDKLGFAEFIFPENETIVLNDLFNYFKK